MYLQLLVAYQGLACGREAGDGYAFVAYLHADGVCFGVDGFAEGGSLPGTALEEECNHADAYGDGTQQDDGASEAAVRIGLPDAYAHEDASADAGNAPREGHDFECHEGEANDGYDDDYPERHGFVFLILLFFVGKIDRFDVGDVLADGVGDVGAEGAVGAQVAGLELLGDAEHVL